MLRLLFFTRGILMRPWTMPGRSPRLRTLVMWRPMPQGFSPFSAAMPSPTVVPSTRPCSGLAEERHEENAGVELVDRDWCWRVPDYRFATSRATEDPGYVGSYVMDALAMGLHCLYVTDSFEAAVLRAANTCGDADTIAAVTGQLAGAVYGASAIPAAWRHAVQQWTAGATYRACRLFQMGTSHMHSTGTPPHVASS